MSRRRSQVLDGLFWSACVVLLATACPGPGYPVCANDQHCAATGEVCVYGQCHGCALDSHCPSEKECRHYRCEPRRMCTTNADCKDGLVCREDKCVPECVTDSECPEGSACKDNRCVQREDQAPACQQHGDCPAGQACRAGACVVPREGDADYEAVYQTPQQPEAQGGPMSGLDVAGGRMLCGEEVRVFFGFNESLLGQEARVTLSRAAECLNKNRAWNITLLGHTDERGSTEYNLALGERRALAVRLYLKDLGVDPKRMVPVSAGEERPLDPGHDEAAWSQNRRVELLPRQ